MSNPASSVASVIPNTMNNVNNAMGINKVNYNAMNNVVKNLISSDKADSIADKLCEQLGNQQYRVFYCKVAYTLSESQIWTSLEVALKGKNPPRYFTWLVKKQMGTQ